MTKKIMSIAAIAAIFTTGANAFDAQRATGVAGLETSTLEFKAAEMNATNILQATAAIAPGSNQKGDALIYPAFYSQNGWSSEFSVINHSSTDAVIAKVVLYSAYTSKELRDFNIYLSANDVFRATIKDGKIVSTDSSTRASVQDTVSASDFATTGYTRADSAPMASVAQPFESTVNEPVGYIGVFAMAEANSTQSKVSGYASYHQKHNELWKDYRHLLDQCRGEGWRTSSNNNGGIFVSPTMGVPNTNLDANNSIVKSDEKLAGTESNCSLIGSMQYTSTTTTKDINNSGVKFINPENILSGSILVKGSDSKGTRSILLPATAISNFTDSNQTVGLLWSEGEYAHIADRCLMATPAADTNVTTKYPNSLEYNTTCLANDIANFNITSTNYEFRDAENTQLLITQPYKRILVQINDQKDTLPFTNAESDVNATFAARADYYSKKIVRAKDSAGKIQNVTNYGEFDLANPSIYDDNENKSTSSSNGFIVSPAPVATVSDGIKNELAVFNPLGDYTDSKSGFAVVNYQANAHGIVTQMSVDAADSDGQAYEVNWIYPANN